MNVGLGWFVEFSLSFIERDSGPLGPLGRSFQIQVFFSSSFSRFFTLQCSLLNVKTLQSKEQKQRKQRMEESQ